MKTVILKPKKKGLKVRKPDGSHLEPEGEKVSYNAYWVRRINEGDVVQLKSLPNKEPAPAKEETK